ncbi:MAG: hypothetical protein CXX80_05945 [Methanobacteriota archaeon]|nr:MAG: hypothetical protein CXX81_29845 [Euryarchaeota archaeon]PXY74891.1 MAG: hypothetical protein CXX80_05945 [Euryarchaeota archaeon]PXY78523.1 MAG: hypothetical protein CXX81_07280 [Euryarchaeota archaeon]HIA25634.1 hypothetical protein [Candidatus Poseidoniales archaeon]HIO86523.1 hypothetical protein [Candidatus Poseidoniales archaeon]
MDTFDSQLGLGILVCAFGLWLLYERWWWTEEPVIKARPVKYHLFSAGLWTIFFFGLLFFVTADPEFSLKYISSAAGIGMGLCFVGPVFFIWLIRDPSEAPEGVAVTKNSNPKRD